VIQDHSDHGGLKELINPSPEVIHWLRVPSMYHDLSVLEPLILIQIIVKERTLIVKLLRVPYRYLCML